jgi:hypothetical protein
LRREISKVARELAALARNLFVHKLVRYKYLDDVSQLVLSDTVTIFMMIIDCSFSSNYCTDVDPGGG